jgi:hypothetical protein
MKTNLLMATGFLVALGGVIACSSDDGGGGGGTKPGTSPQCQTSTYLAFDSANHASQDTRVAAHTQMNTLMTGAAADLKAGDATAAAKKFTDARALYADPVASAKLQEKVRGRLDEHVPGDPLQGDRMDATIVAWLEYGAKAQTELEAKVAKQWVDKTLSEFFFLSVHHEILLGARPKWDEGFGYFGSGPSNDEAKLQGLASTAFKRDSTNGTNLGPSIFNSFIDGSCELDTALRAEKLETLDPLASAKLAPLVEAIDRDLQKVLAFSVGHEAFEMRDLAKASPRDDAETTIKAAELIPFFIPLERIMNAKGGESAKRAGEVRAVLDKIPLSDPKTFAPADTAWIDALGTGPDTILSALEAEYGIVIKG